MNYREIHKKRAKKTQRLTWVLLLICLTATFAYLRTRLWVIDLSYEYNHLQQTLSQLQNDNAKLRLEVGHLRTPNRVENFARTQLGLKRREEIQRTTTVMLSQP